MHTKTLFLLVAAGLTLYACGGSSGSDTNTGTNTDNTDSSTDTGGGEWAIPQSEVVDGGPGKDGIPAIDNPEYVTVNEKNLSSGDLVVGVKSGGEIKAYPHGIMNWHEIVNDTVGGTELAINFCPLTGSAMAWKVPEAFGNKTFGVSGLLYNNNLILYDRETDSNWSQMLIESVNGPEIGAVPEHIAVVETTWETWKQMYPDSLVLSDDTGFSRDYGTNPYGDYPTNESLLFEADNTEDDRLPLKERVLGVRQSDTNKVYPVQDFAPDIELLNEQFSGIPLAVVGSSGFNYAAAFERTLADGTVLTFTAVKGDLPVVMTDDEGNQWDIFGTAVAGPRAGETLTPARGYIAYWFAWTAFYPDSQIHAFD